MSLPNRACSGRGYAPGRPARQKFRVSFALRLFGRHAPPLTLSLGWWWKWKRSRRLAKGSGGHRLGGWNLRKVARLRAEAVCETEGQAVGSRLAGQRPSVDEAKRLQCSAQVVGWGAGGGTALWQGKAVFWRGSRGVVNAPWGRRPGRKASAV